MKYTSQQMIQALKDGKSFWFYHISTGELLYKATLVNGAIVVEWEGQQTAYLFDNGKPTCVDSWICTKIEGEETMTNKPHKHAELIKKWADGAVIQVKTLSGTWVDACDNNPFWEPNHEYRVKPTLVKKWKWVILNNQPPRPQITSPKINQHCTAATPPSKGGENYLYLYNILILK